LPENSRAFLQVDSLVAGYGKKQVLYGTSLVVADREIVALIGHNGAGKSTLLKVIFGLLPIWDGQVIFNGTTVSVPRPRELLKMGIGYVPQGNLVFADLTVRENLEMGGVSLPDKTSLTEGIERVLHLFPTLKYRMRQRAGTLSGGEKQMLALANAVILHPRMLLLDEPSLGLAPPLVTEALARIQQINRESSVNVLIVEQKVREVLKIAHRAYVLKNGSVSYSGAAEVLRDETTLLSVYL
jgi:ABC-type branched-subunit amino acid transport system ATPase component